MRWRTTVAFIWVIGLSACGGGGDGTTSGASATLSVAVVGNGVVSSQPAGIDCGVHCSAEVTLGTKVHLTATPSTGNVFSSWNGACSGTATTCTLTVNSAQSVTAMGSDLGAGTQVLTHIPWFLLPDLRGEALRTLCMGAGWAINAGVAEWIIARHSLGAAATS